MPWFMRRLREGFCVRVNPLNPRQRTRISFERCRMIVFWSKDPRLLLPHLDELAARGVSFYLQYTLNNYEPEGLEPRLPPLAVRIDTMRRFAARWGKERIVWRFDPLLLGAQLHPAALVDRIDRLGRELCAYTGQLVFSFLDLYAKVRPRLRDHPAGVRAVNEDEIRALATGIAALCRSWPSPLTPAACAESLDLTPYGVGKSACIDAARIMRLCPDVPELAALCGAPGQSSLLPPAAHKPPKDTHQRPACACLPSRDIGAYNTCMHLCVYCYANHTEAAVIANMARVDRDAAALCNR